MTKIKDRPITYSAPMVLAKIAGRKSQTRRIANFFDNDEVMQFTPRFEDGWWKAAHEGYECQCPYGVVGDVLRTREAFRIHAFSNYAREGRWVQGKYLADRTTFYSILTVEEMAKLRRWKEPFKGKAAMYMFRSLSRMYDEITDIRVERLQKITPDDAKAEGVYECSSGYWWADPDSQKWLARDPVEAYMRLWTDINGAGSWERDKDKWTWVVSFNSIIL